MKIAIITGASSGIGREFAERIGNSEDLDEIWVIARRIDRLEELKNTIKIPVVPLSLDLTDDEDIEKYRRRLIDTNPNVRLLVNAAGYGRIGHAESITNFEQSGMIDLNVKALTEMTLITLLYMSEGAKIYQLASMSSFMPVPYLSVYAATKAYVLSFSRSLNVELKTRGIRVMAVAPGWVRTEFLNRAEDENEMVVYYDRFYNSSEVVSRALLDMEKGKDVSICGVATRMKIFGMKCMPHCITMKIWCKQQRKKRKAKKLEN
jgi:short-subunit dehydrogenase